MTEQTLIERLRTRANMRRNATNRKSVQNGEPDRISDLLEESADEIAKLQYELAELENALNNTIRQRDEWKNHVEVMKYDIKFLKDKIIELVNDHE